MCPGVLSKVVRAREFLPTFIAFKWLVLSVERAVVTLEMFLETETSRAESADEGLGGIFS